MLPTSLARPARRRLAGVLLLTACARAAAPDAAPAPAPGAVEVQVDLDEAEAALAIMNAAASDAPVPDSAWTRLHAAAGYRRLAERERAMGRPFTDDAFAAFLRSDTLLARTPALAAAVQRWRAVDVSGAARRAASYLPADQPLRATLFPVIKPRDNSFVWELDRDPAFFVYVDPSVGAAEQQNVIAHELHHVGLAAACRAPAATPTDSVAARRQAALQWLGAFGEGVAMLAAAGGPAVHPHATSADSVRARWDRDVANAPADLARVATFLTRVLDGAVSGDALRTEAMALYGEQGPWYTVGYVMARVVETAHGRARLVGALCDPVALLTAYESAAVQLNAARRDPHAARAGALPSPLPRWPAALLARLGVTPSGP